MDVIAAINPESTWRIIVACGLLMVLIVAGFLVVWYYRKNVLYSEDASGEELWTLDDLRKMRSRGDLSEEEFQSLRAAMIGSLAGAGKPVASPNGNPASMPGNADFDVEKDTQG